MHFEADGVEHRTVLRFMCIYAIHLNSDLVLKNRQQLCEE